MLLGVVADGVFVTAENIDGVAADAQARAGDLAAIDGVAHGSVCGAGAFGAHVALGGEPGEEIVPSGDGGRDGALRNGFCDCLQISAPGWRKRWTCASIKPGRRVVSPRSIISALLGRETFTPTSFMASPSIRISPGVAMRPDSTSSRRAA